MTFDSAQENGDKADGETRRIYVCECGDICVETRNSRQSFSPAEFVTVLRKILMKEEIKENRILSIRRRSNKIGGIRGLIVVAVCLSFLSSCATNAPISADDKTERIVSVGGSATEIVYELGAGEKLVGTDTSSIYPEAATKLPQVGYQRTLSAEGVLSLKPTLVIILPEAGPPAAIQQIESAGVKLLRVGNESSPEGAKAKIRQIAEALNRKEKGEEIVKKLENDLAEAEKQAATKTPKPKVLFIYSRGSGATQVGGRGTPADAMIKMAGGANAMTEFSDYKPLTPEALVTAQPDVILLPARGLASLGGIEAVLNLPGVSETPAGKNKKIVSIDDMLLLGFTPRLGTGVKELCEKIH